MWTISISTKIHLKGNNYKSKNLSSYLLIVVNVVRVVKEDFQIISKAFKNQFKIPKFGDFCSIIKDIYEECKEIKDGNVASYIPQLASYDPNYWGISVCTVDGQRFISQLNNKT